MGVPIATGTKAGDGVWVLVGFECCSFPLSSAADHKGSAVTPGWGGREGHFCTAKGGGQTSSQCHQLRYLRGEKRCGG